MRFTKMLRRMFIVVMLMTWSQKTIADDLKEIPSPDREITINLGQKAPFSGILMDVDQYQYFKIREFEADTLSRLAVESPKGSPPAAVVILLSAVAGGLLTYGAVSLFRPK